MIWYRRGRYWYKKPTGHATPHEIRHCARAACGELFFGVRYPPGSTLGRFCSIRCSRLGRGHAPGAANPSWKGGEVTYTSSHFRVYRYRGKAQRCLFGCLDVARYEWANLTGDLANPDDYVEMCARCHRRFDAAIRAMAKVGPWKARTSLAGGL